MAASAIEAKLDALIALMTAQAQATATVPQIQTAPAVPQTPSSDPAKPVKATAKNKADREAVPANEVSGTIKRIAKSGTGLVLAETDQWYNLISDGNPIFKGLPIGTRIRLERNKLGRVVMAHLQTPETQEAAPKGAAAPQTPKPQTPKTVTPPPATPAVPTGCKVAKDGTLRLPCEFCKGEIHNKYSADQVARECAVRQYLTANPGADVPTTANLAAEIAYLTWRSTNTIKVFAFNKAGFETLGLAPTSTAMAASVASATVAPTVSTPKPEAAKAASPKPVGSAIGRTVRRTAQTASTPPTPPAAAASVGSSTVTPDSASLVVAPTPTAPATTATESTATPSKPEAYEPNVVYKGYLVRHAGKPIGMIKFLTASHPGPKGDGNWFYSSEKVRGEIVKYNEGDRIAVVLGYIKNTSGVMELGIVKHKLLGSVEKETGAVAGVKTSGKQQPAEPRKPLVDRRVKAATPEQKAKLARESRGAARREAQAGRSSKSGFLTTLISALIV